MKAIYEFFFGNDLKAIITVIGFLGGIIATIRVWYRKRVTRENLKTIGNAFRKTVEGLSSSKNEVRMSSAILLRRFFDGSSEYGVGGTPFAKPTISVIAAILKNMQTSDFQKVLSDSLRFAPTGYLDGADFQRANLSKAFLGGKHVSMVRADFFQANLSGSLLKEAVLNDAQFYEASLCDTRFGGAQLRGANFSYAVLHKVNFRDADLTGACFDHARLREVDFTGAKLEGARGLDALGYENKNAPDFIRPMPQSAAESRRIFISRLGILDTRQRLLLENVKDVITKSGFSCVELNRDMYDASNVLSKLSRRIDACTAMIVFGFKSVHVIDGVFRYSTADSRHVTDEFLSTPWNHIEVGMAVMKRLPVLMLIDEGITDGAFHSNVKDELVLKLPIQCCLDEKQQNVLSWLRSICVPEEIAHPAKAAK